MGVVRMEMQFIVVFLNVCLMLIHCQDSSYDAVVVAYGPNLNEFSSPEERLNRNIQNYIVIIEDVTKNKTVDLIVFPELTLMYLDKNSSTAAVIPPLNDVILCNSTIEYYADFLKKFSCAAIKYNTTIVINLTEKEKCDSATGCEVNKDNLYNTNVVFGINGSIISRYRKWNLFGEKTKPQSVDLSTFEINNNTFGMITCFDILFVTPLFNLTKQKNVKNVIFTLHWISELPYLTAIQVQQMWAQELDIVLLAAAATLPDIGAGGSGIYIGQHGPLEYAILNIHGTAVISQTVPSTTNLYNRTNFGSTEDNADIDVTANSMDSFYLLSDPSIKDHSFIVLDTEASAVSEKVCSKYDDEILCCDFNISLSKNGDVATENRNFYAYLLVAFTGVRTYSGYYNAGIDTCGVVACLNQSLASCGLRFKNYSTIVWPLTFNSINITGNFSKSENKIQFPSTLLSSIRPLPIQEYLWKNDTISSTVASRILQLTKPQSRLLTFGIFGRDFSRDYDPNQS